MNARWVRVSACLLWLLVGCSGSEGRLELSILADGESTPARVELLDASGRAWIAPDALTVVSFRV